MSGQSYRDCHGQCPGWVLAARACLSAAFFIIRVVTGVTEEGAAGIASLLSLAAQLVHNGTSVTDVCIVLNATFEDARRTTHWSPLSVDEEEIRDMH